MCEVVFVCGDIQAERSILNTNEGSDHSGVLLPLVYFDSCGTVFIVVGNVELSGSQAA